jgi:hypothetical protein
VDIAGGGGATLSVVVVLPEEPQPDRAIALAIIATPKAIRRRGVNLLI